jgi:hypothetical protein
MTMLDKLSQHDKRVLTIGLSAAAIMVVYVYIVAPWAADWKQTRAAIATNMKVIDSLEGSVSRRANQASIVPIMTMPIAAEKQQQLFKTMVNKQLTDAGIQVKSLQYITVGKTANNLGFTVSKLKCDGKCSMSQAARLLGSLPENPYLLGLDEVRLSCDPKKRDEITLSMTLSTFCDNQ